jgi:hypothetical protein
MAINVGTKRMSSKSAKAKGDPKNCPCACLEDLLASGLNHYG